MKKTKDELQNELTEAQQHELSAAVDALVAQSKANTARIKQLDKRNYSFSV